MPKLNFHNKKFKINMTDSAFRISHIIMIMELDRDLEESHIL